MSNRTDDQMLFVYLLLSTDIKAALHLISGLQHTIFTLQIVHLWFVLRYRVLLDFPSQSTHLPSCNIHNQPRTRAPFLSYQVEVSPVAFFPLFLLHGQFLQQTFYSSLSKEITGPMRICLL